MEHLVTEETGRTVVALAGEVDLQHSPAARKALLGAVERACPVFVDLSSVTYIDSSGIASLVEAYQSARKAGTDFALVRVSEAAMRVLALARLDKVFTVLDHLDDGT
jgi:anti-sigma B factor antagonist